MFPIHLDLGFKVIHFYEGFYFAISILAATAVISHSLKRAGLGVGVFLESVTWILLGSIVGARIFHFFFWDPKTLIADPIGFLRFWEGGLSITGGLAGGGGAAYLFFRRRELDFWHYFAIGSPGLLIGQAIGRVGCFLNGDAWGIPTRLPWGIPMAKFGTRIPGFMVDKWAPSEVWLWSVKQGFTDPATSKTIPLHPTQLYECFGDLALIGLVLLLTSSIRKGNGPWSKVFWLHFGGYSILRFGLEFLHGDRDATVWLGMTSLQIGLLVFGALSSCLYLRATALA